MLYELPQDRKKIKDEWHEKIKRGYETAGKPIVANLVEVDGNTDERVPEPMDVHDDHNSAA